METNQMNYGEILAKLRSMANAKNVVGMARFGIGGQQVLGISIVDIRSLAKHIGHNHKLALELWESGVHEARILASIIDVVAEVTPSQMDDWIKDIDSWDLCDQVMGNLFCETPYAITKIHEWSSREPEFEKRSAYSLIAYVTVHQKQLPDDELLKLLPLIRRASTDPRNFVKKAVNWALRQIGKRSELLLPHALQLATELSVSTDKTARWIGIDAVKELSAYPKRKTASHK